MEITSPDEFYEFDKDKTNLHYYNIQLKLNIFMRPPFQPPTKYEIQLSMQILSFMYHKF